MSKLTIPKRISSKTETKPKSKDQEYDIKDHRQHIYDIPDTYVGSDEKRERLVWLYNHESNKMERQTITLPFALEQIVKEIFNNAGDNAPISRRDGYDPQNIKIDVKDNNITVTNFGKPIPITINEKTGLYNPAMIFGKLLTSSNYDTEKDRITGGRNGYGAKLTNIFSNRFSIDIIDETRKLRYQQVWTDNMKNRQDEIITETNDKSKVTISFDIDLERFGYQELPEELISLINRYCYDMSFTYKIPVIYNGKKIDTTSLNKITKIYFPDSTKNIIWTSDDKDIPDYEVVILDTPHDGKVVSFANGIMNINGGSHVEAAWNVIVPYVKSILDNKKISKDQKDKIKITKTNIVPHISLIISVHVTNPKFDGQTKDRLSSPTEKQIKYQIDPKLLDKLKNWELFNVLLKLIDRKNMDELKKTDGIKRKNIGKVKGHDANLAGTKDSDKCCLIIVEGLSAYSYVTNMMDIIPEAKDYYGCLPLKGKILNVMDKSEYKISLNDEINEFKRISGIGEETDYNEATNYNTLRYGKFIILTDADHDGDHIKALFLNLLHCRYPSLIEKKVVFQYKTPMLRVTSGLTKKNFYTEREFEEWRKNNKDKKIKVEYFKGLGSSEKKDIELDYKNRKVVVCEYDHNKEESKADFKKIFASSMSDYRKDWIQNQEVTEDLEDDNELSEFNNPKSSSETITNQTRTEKISDFFNNDLVEFSRANLHRSLPGMDGLKNAIRKLTWYAYIKWANSDKTKWLTSFVKIKTGIFCSGASELTHYKHGENSLVEGAKKLNQNFVGSNNYPLLQESGSTGGTRNMGGKDAADQRYTYTLPSYILPLLIRNEDFPLLTPEMEEIYEVEPKRFFPVLPIVLLNGSRGIGSGWSTNIPKYNIFEIINWLINRNQGQETFKLNPWFKGFKGEVEIKDKQIITKGKYELHKRKKDTVIITELPIGIWTKTYIDWVDEMKKDKIFKDSRDLSKLDDINIEINGVQNPSLESLKLITKMSTSNMYILDDNNKPVKYDTVEEILESFYQWRLPKYQARKDYQLNNLNQVKKKKEDKVKFISLVIANQLIINKRAKKDILVDMEKHQLPANLLTDVRAGCFSQDKIDEYNSEIEQIKKQISELENKSPNDIWISDLIELQQKCQKNEKVKK